MPLTSHYPFRTGTLMNSVTLSDTSAQLFTGQDGSIDYCNGFHVNTNGNLKVTFADTSSSDVTLVVTAGTFYPYSVRLFWNAGSTGGMTVFATR